MRIVPVAVTAFAIWVMMPCIGNSAEPEWQSWTTLTRPSKYAGHFPHYDYVNPQAPKGGTLNQVVADTFDSLNPYIQGGRAPSPGLQPFGGGLLYDTLMDQSLEEDSVSYANVASAVQSPPDNSRARFRLNPKARWHDGMPITAEDVVWSFTVLQKISPFYRSYYAAVDRAEVTGDHEVTFFFKTAGNRELPKIMGDLVILPRHWWEGTDKNGKKRDITRPTLEIPLGSGPYRIESFDPGKTIIWKRVPDAWGSTMPQNIGRYNFDRIRYNYLLDEKAVWESFKKGGIYDYRMENIIGRWMEDYTFPAVRRGKVRKVSFPTHYSAYSGVYQAYFLNTRRSQFADVRVRKALALALDFESINRALYFGRYRRLTSYYGDQAISARGVPEGREREILETVREEVPAALFSEPFQLPVYKTPQDGRAYLADAMALLVEAGWRLEGNRLVDKNGRPFIIEFLLNTPALERATFFYITNLKRLGIDATIRTVDSSQYQYRRENFDFDIIVEAMVQSSSPGNEQAGYFGSAYAGRTGSRNFSGVSNPAVDTLLDHLIHAQTYEEVAATARAIDRVLLWNYYSVPNWGAAQQNIAYWNKFGIPEKQPAHVVVDPFSWWIDPEKEKTLYNR